jgi:hypothetical protein
MRRSRVQKNVKREDGSDDSVKDRVERRTKRRVNGLRRACDRCGPGGLRALHEFRKRGLSVKVIEAGADIGGVWHWNGYPGARTDSESWVYCFQFDQDLLQEWDWPERFPTQPQMLQYIEHVANSIPMSSRRPMTK